MQYCIHLAALAAATAFYFSGACLATGNAPAYPLKPSLSGRYLVDQNAIPFMILGDSPQAAIGKLSPSNLDWYFANMQAILGIAWSQTTVTGSSPTATAGSPAKGP